MLRVSPKKMESEEMKDTAMLTRLFYPGHRKRYRASREEEDGRRRSSIEEKWSIESPQVQIKYQDSVQQTRENLGLKRRIQVVDANFGGRLRVEREGRHGAQEPMLEMLSFRWRVEEKSISK